MSAHQPLDEQPLDEPEIAEPVRAPAEPTAPRKRHHRLRWFFAILGGLVLLVAGMLWYGLTSEWAAKTLLARGLAATGGAVKIGRVTGRLRGPLYLHDIRVKNPTLAVTVDSVRLEWTPTGLLHRQVRVDRLHVVGVHVVLPDSTPRDTSTASPKRPDLPIDVVLGDVRVDGLAIDAPGQVRVRGGHGRVTGHAKDYRIAAGATVSAPALKEPVALRAAGGGDLEHVSLDSAFADLLRGHVAAKGRVGWWPKVNWRLNLEAEDLQPRLAMADTTAWPGAIGARAATVGYLDSIGPIGQLRVLALSGRLRRQPLSGTADVHFHGKEMRLPALDAGWGSARAVASGAVIDSNVTFRYRVTVGDLRTAMPGARGALAMTGTAAGPMKGPRVRADVTGRDLVYGTNGVARLAGRADVNLAPGGRNDVRLTGDRARVGADVIDRIVLALQGTQGSHHLTAQAAGAHATADLALDGGLHGKRWQGRVSALDLRGDSVGVWRLERPAALSAAATSTTLGDLCVGSGSARLCAAGTWRDLNNWRINSTVDRLPLSTLLAFASVWRPTAAAPASPAAAAAAPTASHPQPAPGQQPAPVQSIVVDTTRLGMARPDSLRGDSLRADSALGYAPNALAARAQAAAESTAARPIAARPPAAESTGVASASPPAADTAVAPRPTIAGLLNARLAATAVAGRPNGQFHIALDQAALTFHARPDTGPRRVLLDTAVVETRAGADGVHGTMRLTLHGVDRSPIGDLRGELALPGYTRLGRPLEREAITARLDGALVNLGFLRAFLPQADSVNGRITLASKVDGIVASPRVDASLRVTDIVAWLQEGRAARGSVDATLVATVGRGQGRPLDATLRVVPRGWLYDYLLDKEPRRIAVDSGGLEVRANAQGVHGAFGLAVSDTAHTRLVSLSSTLALPGYHSLDQELRTQPLALRATAAIPDLGLAQPWAPAFDSLAGRLGLDLGVDGTLATPRVRGTLRIDSITAHTQRGSMVTGALAGDLTAEVAPDSTLTAELRLVPRGFVISPATNVRQRVLVDTTGLAFRVGRDGARGTLGIHLTDTAGTKLGDIDGRLALPRYHGLGDSLPIQPVEGRLDANITNLAFAEAFSSQVDSLSGRLTSDVSVAGTIGAPRVAGALRLQDVAARLPLLGAFFHDVQVTAQGDQQGAVSIDGRARSGPGRLAITGSTPVRSTAAKPGRIRIEGDSFEVMNTEQARALVSPALTVTLAGDSMDVRGDFRVPYARLELNDMPESAVSPSPDVVFVDDSATRQAASAQRLFAQVRLILGDSVTFKGFNFTGRFGGDLLVTERPARPLVGSGAIIIAEGHYQAYNQDLTITNGRIRYAGGPLDNPALEVRASRTAEDSTVAGLDFGGTLKQPQVTIFSDPPMSQDRALEYIVLGHARNDTTQSGPSGSLTDKAVSAAGLRGGQLLAQNLGKGLGLNEATIKTTGGDPKSASLVAGKYLSPRLYVSYGFGLFDPNTELRLRYLLSNRWTLQAESGEASGADLFYKIEAGK